MSYAAGIIGAGGVAGLGLLGTHEDVGKRKAMASHAGGYSRTEGMDLVAIADKDPGKLARFGAAWDIPRDRRYGNHREMLEAEDLDVVSVCTPTFLHRQHVLNVMDSKTAPKAIWCEKPVATSVSDAETMARAADEAGCAIVVNHSFRFDPKLQALRELIREKDLLGNVRSVSANFRMELMRNATHLLDTLAFLLPGRPVRASGYLTGENEASEALGVDRPVDDTGGGGWLVADDGAFVTVDCTAPRGISSMSYQLIGTKGKLYLNNDDGEWRYWRLEGGEHVEAPLPGIDGAWSWDADYEGTFARAARHVADVLEGRAENLSTVADATRSLEVIVAFYVSHLTRGVVELPLAKTLKDVSISSW